MIFAKPAIHNSGKRAEKLSANFDKSTLQTVQSRLIIGHMKTTDVIAYFGSIAALAAALKCHRNSIYQWGENVPPARQYELEVKTGGALVSDYSTAAEAATGRQKKRRR